MADGSEKKVVEKILTGLFDGTDVPDYKNVPGIKFYSEEKKDFQTYKDFENAGVTSKNIGRVSITVDGKERFFKKIVQNEATDDKAIAEVSSKTVDKSASGLKATAWIETDGGKDANPVDKDGAALTGDKKAEVILTFPGFKGNPSSTTTQTESARAAERGELYPPTAQMAKFLATVDTQLKKMGVKESNTHIAAHSFGSPNALAAAALLGDKAKDVFLEDPVTASGNLDILKKMTPEALAKKLNITDEQAKKAVQDIKGIEAKTTSRRSVDEDGALSNAAMLEVLKGDHDAPKSKADIDKNHQKNMGGLIPSGTAVLGRDGNDPKKVDPKNEMVGKKEYEFVSRSTIKENGLRSIAGIADPKHALSNSVYAEQNGAPTAPSIDKLKEKAQEKPKEPPHGLDAAMVKALHQVGVSQEHINKAHHIMKAFVKHGMSGVNGVVESLGMESTLKHAGKEVAEIAKKIADSSKNNRTLS